MSLPDPGCNFCHGQGSFWEDVAGDGRGSMQVECDCQDPTRCFRCDRQLDEADVCPVCGDPWNRYADQPDPTDGEGDPNEGESRWAH